MDASDDEIMHATIPMVLCNSRRGKDAIADGLAHAIRKTRPAAVAISVTMYQTRVPCDDMTSEDWQAWRESQIPPSRPRPRDDPERVECLWLAAFDSTTTLGFTSDITRDGRQPPVYAPWQSSLPGLAGLMVEPIEQAMREPVRGLR